MTHHEHRPLTFRQAGKCACQLPPPLPGPRRGSASLIQSFNYAFEGVIWALRTQRNMRLHFAAAAAALVLLGCVNVSGLMAARSLDRQREIDLRRALSRRADAARRTA